MGSELVLSCVMPYIQQDIDVLNSVSLVSKKYYEIDSLTRKHLTVHVLFAPDPERVSRRFPNIESLTLKSYSPGYNSGDKCRIPVTPWIQEIAVKFEFLKSLSIRHMAIFPSDLKLLANTRGGSLQRLEILRCIMFSDDGLVDIAKDCIDLRSLHLDWNHIDGNENGKWLHELALHNTVMESLHFEYFFDRYNIEDVTLLAKNCSNSLVYLNNGFSHSLIDFKQVCKHAKKLDHFGVGIVDDAFEDYSGFEFPPNIRGLRFEDLYHTRPPFLRPYLHQLRELVLTYNETQPNCECHFFKSCPNLEVLYTQDICGDIGCRLIGQFCKKLRKLTLAGSAVMTLLGLKAVGQGCPDLVYLEVHISDISNEAFECVGTHLKNLRDFRISWYYGVREETNPPLDSGVRAMLICCSKLERLDFRLGGLTDVGFRYVGKYGHNLRSLSLSHTGESDIGLLELAKGCPKLRKLKLHRCPFSEQAIATLVFNLNKSLRYTRVTTNDSAGYLVHIRPMVSTEE